MQGSSNCAVTVSIGLDNDDNGTALSIGSGLNAGKVVLQGGKSNAMNGSLVWIGRRRNSASL
jgi:class 3 adenylate cyclase